MLELTFEDGHKQNRQFEEEKTVWEDPREGTMLAIF